MIILPNRTTKQVKQTNRSKVLGDLWASFNIDLHSNLGVIKVSPRLQLNTGSVANQGLSVAFKSFDVNTWTIAGTRVFKSSARNLITAFTEDASAGAITDYDPNYSDMEMFNLLLFASSTTKIMSKVSDGSGTGAWISRYSLSTSDCVHNMCNFSKFNRLYFIDVYNQIKSMDTTYTTATSGDYFINLPYELGGTPYVIDADSTDIWIGTTKLQTGNINTMDGASILRWDGISNQITQEYKVKAKGVLALCKDDRNIMHAITSDGQLLQFTGSGFEEIGRLPLNRDYLINALPDGNGKYDAFIHPNGLKFTRNGTFIALINNLVGDSGSTIKENMPSGIWEFHKDTGFVHRQSVSYNPMTTSTITDHGQNRVSAVGALAEANIYSTSATGKPTIICGVNYYTNASSPTSGIFIDEPLDAVQKYGYFVTTWIQSQNLKDSWKTVALKYRRLLSTTDRLWIKYRTIEAIATELSLTWVSTTSFTTTTDMTTFVGYEVEVIQGTGSGKCAHITSVTNNAGTYTVVVDETFTGATGTAKARVQNWKKAMTVADQLTESQIKTVPGAPNAERIQFKVCMQFTGEDELHEFIGVNSVQVALT